MKLENGLIKECDFTDIEKQQAKKIILKIVELSEKARRYGLLSIENEYENIDDEFLIFALRLVIDGVEPEMIESILMTNIRFSKLTGVELLKRLIICDGALLLQDGCNPRLMLTKLSMFLGDYGFSLLNNEDLSQNVASFLKLIENKKANSGYNEKFDSVMIKLNGFALQRLFREIAITDFIPILSGCSGGVIAKVFNNLSKDVQFDIYSLLENKIENYNSRECEEAQKSVMLIIKRLRELGEIV